MVTNGGRFFPDYIVDRKIWVLWRIEPDAKGRNTKVPYSGKYDGHASSKKSNTWCTFRQAVDKLEHSKGYYGGVGISISREDRIIFIDIDHCIDADGNFNDIAKDILDRVGDQYVEISQSGTGLHILVLGEIPRSFNNRKYGVEMYNSRRIASLTGNAISMHEPSEATDALRYIFDKYKTEEAEPIIRREVPIEEYHDDEWIIEHASKQARFRDLYEGFHRYKSDSEADIALCGMLAFWTNCNPDQMDSIFRSSGLFRRKWERTDYRNKTINKAIRNCRRTLAEYMRETNNQ